MKPLKRLISVLILLFSVLCFGSAYAAEAILDLNLEAGKYVVQGEQITIPVLLTAVDAERFVGGAAFSVNFDVDVLEFKGAKSSFFGTFASHSIKPKSIQPDPPDGPVYTSPLVYNTPLGTGMAMIAAARPDVVRIDAGDSVILFELNFKAVDSPGDPDAEHAITLSQSEIYNPDAGYGDVGNPGVKAPIVALIDGNTLEPVIVDFGESAAVMLAIHNADDRDNDGLSNAKDNNEEKAYGTNPDIADTDGDGISDGDEVYPPTTDPPTPATNPKLADSDKDGFTDKQEILLGTSPTNGEDSPDLQLQMERVVVTQDGSVDPDDPDGALRDYIPFDYVYVNPVVVAGPVSLDRRDPAADPDATFIQIYDVIPASFDDETGALLDTGGFKIKLTDTGLALTPGTSSGTVHYIAMESGPFALDNGKRIFAGKLDSKSQKKANKFEKVKLPKKLFKQTPVVLASTNSVNDLDEPAAVRLDKVKKTGFSFTLQEDSANQQKDAENPGHGPEQVSFIAFDTFTDIFGEAPLAGEENTQIILEIGSRAKAFGDGEVAFAKAHSDTPIFLADMQTAKDKDSAQLRFNNNIMGSERFVELFVQEDDGIGFGDTGHNNPKKLETVGYFATSDIDLNDPDGDGLETDYELFIHKTDPALWDTDGDGLSDGEELGFGIVPGIGTDPLVWDTDEDGAGDGHEEGTSPGSGNALNAAVMPDFFFELQQVTINGAWGNITFNSDFSDPVIVAPYSSAEMIQIDPLTGPSLVGDMNPEIVQIQKLTNPLDGTLQSWQIRSKPLAIKMLGDDPTTLEEVETEYVYIPEQSEAIERRATVMIVERGTFLDSDENGDAVVIIAGSDTYQQSKKNKAKNIKFPKLPKSIKAAVAFASVTSVKDEQTPIYHRLVKVSKKGLSYIFQKEEYKDNGKHVILEDGQPTKEGEMLSYIAFAGASSDIFGRAIANVPVNGTATTGFYGYEVMLHKKVLGGVENPFDPSPMGLDVDSSIRGGMLDMQSAYDKDPANARYREVWDTATTGSNPATDPPDTYLPFISEDKSSDAETSHKMENVGTLLILDDPSG